MISLSLLLTVHLRIFQHPRVRSSTGCYPSFNLTMSRSPPLRVYCRRQTRYSHSLSLGHRPLRATAAADNNSQTHYAKGRRSPLRAPTHCRHGVAGSISLPYQGFFSPFPRGTSSLSVARWYLALSRGRDRFARSFTCTALLGIPLGCLEFSRTRLSRSLAGLSRPLR